MGYNQNPILFNKLTAAYVVEPIKYQTMNIMLDSICLFGFLK